MIQSGGIQDEELGLFLEGTCQETKKKKKRAKNCIVSRNVSKCYSLPLGKFSCFFLSSADVFFNHPDTKTLSGAKQFGTRSDLTFCLIPN